MYLPFEYSILEFYAVVLAVCVFFAPGGGFGSFTWFGLSFWEGYRGIMRESLPRYVRMNPHVRIASRTCVSQMFLLTWG